MTKRPDADSRRKWATLRFSIIGPLLAAPPTAGELHQQLEALASKTYQHPITGQPVTFGVSTIERWFYRARSEVRDPVAALTRSPHPQAGRHRGIHSALEQFLRCQHQHHPSWSYRLHYDTLQVALEQSPELAPLPSYATVRRFMQRAGLVRQRRQRSGVARERRSFEVEHVHGLWHSDFHHGSRKVLLPSGKWVKPKLLGFLDDHSRLVCHLQWYLEETAQVFVHGLSQALMKRGLPRALLTDNGKPMTADETTEGLARLGILHETTLPYSPEQNGKQESFWAQVEGRLMPQLEGVVELTLELLNRATQAWVEQEYNLRVHSETKQTPLRRFLEAPSVGRDCPDSRQLRLAFRITRVRKLRRSDATITVEGQRFELPHRYRMLLEPTVRYARWDLSTVSLVDPHTDQHLCELLPLDKARNADGRRHALVAVEDQPPPVATGIAPLLAKQIRDQEANGLPPAYLPLADEEGDES